MPVKVFCNAIDSRWHCLLCYVITFQVLLLHFQDEPGQPQTEAEYLLMVKKSPDSGNIWSRLISFAAKHKGVESARARAEQALQTVSYRSVYSLSWLVLSAIVRLVRKFAHHVLFPLKVPGVNV